MVWYGMVWYSGFSFDSVCHDRCFVCMRFGVQRMALPLSVSRLIGTGKQPGHKHGCRKFFALDGIVRKTYTRKDVRKTPR